MFKRKQQQQHCEVCVEVRKLIETVEKHKNWAVGNDIPLALRLKSLLQSLLDLEAQFEVEKRDLIRKDGENEKQKGLLLFEFEQLKEVHVKITAELEKYKNQLEELIEEKRDLEEKLRRVREKIVDAEKQLLEEVEEVLLLSHPGLEKKTLSQYERDIQEEADRLFVSGQIQENHKSKSSDISGSVGADKDEGHSYDHEHQTNLKQAEVRSTGSLRSPDEHFEPAQNLNQSAEFTKQDIEKVSQKSESQKKSIASKKARSSSSLSNKDNLETTDIHRSIVHSPSSFKSEKDRNISGEGHSFVDSDSDRHSDRGDSLEPDFDPEYQNLGAYTDSQFDAKMVHRQDTNIDRKSSSEHRNHFSSVDALELEAKVEDSEQESDIELIQTQNDSKLILQGDQLPTFEAGEADLNVSKGSEHDSSYNHHLSHKGSVHSDKVEPESQSRADEIDAEVQDVVETMIEEMQPSAEILKQEEPRVQPEEQDISFEIPEYVMIDGFRVQFSEVEHHVDSRGRLLLPTGEYIQLLHPKSVQMPINQHVDSGDEGQGTLNDSTTFQAHEDVSELANFSEKAQPGLSVELLVDFKHKEENDVSTIKQVTEKDKSFSQEGSIEQEQDTGLCVELVASTKLNDDTDQTPNQAENPQVEIALDLTENSEHTGDQNVLTGDQKEELNSQINEEFQVSIQAEFGGEISEKSTSTRQGGESSFSRVESDEQISKKAKTLQYVETVPDKVQKIKTEVVTREQISNEENIHEAAAFKIQQERGVFESKNDHLESNNDQTLTEDMGQISTATAKISIEFEQEQDPEDFLKNGLETKGEDIKVFNTQEEVSSIDASQKSNSELKVKVEIDAKIGADNIQVEVEDQMPQNTAETLKDADGVNPVVETQESLEKKSDSSEIILEAQTDLISTQKENSDIMSQGLETQLIKSLRSDSDRVNFELESHDVVSHKQDSDKTSSSDEPDILRPSLAEQLEGTELDFENFNVGDDDYDPNASEKSKSGMSHHSLKSSRRNSVEKTYSYEPAKEHRSDDSDSEINVNDPNDPEDEEKSSRSVEHNAEKVSEDTKVEFSAEFTQGPDVDKIDELSQKENSVGSELMNSQAQSITNKQSLDEQVSQDISDHEQNLEIQIAIDCTNLGNQITEETVQGEQILNTSGEISMTLHESGHENQSNGIQHEEVRTHDYTNEEEQIIISPEGHILTSEEITRIKMKLKKKKLADQSIGNSEDNVPTKSEVDDEEQSIELTPEEEEYYSLMFESLDAINQHQDDKLSKTGDEENTKDEKVIEDTIHIEDSVGTLEDHNPAQVGEAEEEINLEDKRDQRHGQESSTLFVEGVNLAEIQTAGIEHSVYDQNEKIEDQKETQQGNSYENQSDSQEKRLKISTENVSELIEEDDTQLTTNYQENSKPDEDSSSEPEHLPNKNQNIEESEIQVEVTEETSTLKETSVVIPVEEEPEKQVEVDLVDEVDTKDQINVPLISFEESFPLEKEDSVEEVKPLVETAPQPEIELVPEPNIEDSLQPEEIPAAEEEPEEELPEDFIEMLKTANLTLNKADQELYEETHSEVRVAIITYHFFLSSTHYIRLEQKIINSQIFYCFKNQLGDVCYVNPLQYANVVKTVIYWKQFLSYPGTSVDILIEQNLRNHKFQSLNIDKFYFIVNSDGEIIDLMTKLVGGHVEYFYYDSNGQKISVSENKLQTNDKSIIIQHKMYPTRISTLSENKFYAINSEGVRNLLNIQTYGKSEVSFSLHQIPQEKYGQITSLELSYDQLRQDSLILTGKDSELERELTLDQCLKICRKKLPVKLIFVNCPQSKSKHVAAPYFTEKSLTYTYINNNSEIVKFTHEEVEREKYSLEYLTIELDANCQKYDSKKSYSIKTNSGEPKQVFTDVEVLGEEVFSLVYYFIGQNGDKIEVEYDRLDSVDLELPDSVFDGTFDSLEYFKEQKNSTVQVDYSKTLDNATLQLLSRCLAGSFEILAEKSGILCKIGYSLIMSNGEKQLLSSEETEYIEIAPGKLIAKKQYYYVSEVGNKVTFPESDINTSQFEKVFILPGQEEPLVKLEKAALEAQKEYESVIYVDSSNHPQKSTDFYLQIDQSPYMLQLKSFIPEQENDQERIIFYDYNKGTRNELRKNFAFGREELYYISSDSQKVVVDPLRLQTRQEIIYYDKDGKKIDPESESYQARQQKALKNSQDDEASEKSSKFSKSKTEEESNIKDPDVTVKVLYEDYSSGETRKIFLEYILGERYLYYFDEGGSKVKVNWSEEEKKAEVKFTYFNALGDQSNMPFEEIARDRMREEDERLMREMIEAENQEYEEEFEEEEEEANLEEEQEDEASEQNISESQQRAGDGREKEAKNIDFNISRIIMYNYVTGDRIELEHQYIKGKLVLFFKDHKGNIVVVEQEKLEADSQQISYYSEEGEMLSEPPKPSDEIILSSTDIQMFSNYRVYGETVVPAINSEVVAQASEKIVQPKVTNKGEIPEIEDYEAGPQLTKVIYCDYETFKRVELGFMYIQGKLVLFEEDSESKLKKEVLPTEDDDDQKQFTYYTEDGDFDSKPPRPSKEILIASYKIFDLNPSPEESTQASMPKVLTEAQKKVIADFDHQREYPMAEHPALVNPDYVDGAKLTKIMYMDYECCENFSLLHRYVQGRIRLFRIDEETDAGIEVEWNRTNENLQFTFYTEDGDFKEIPPLPSKETVVESYKRLKLFEKDAPVDSTSKPKKKIVKKVVKKVAKAIQDTADDKSNQIIGVSESTKTTITPSTKQQIDGQAPKKIVKKIVKKVVKKNPAAENQESLAIDKNLSDLTPVTNSEPQEAKKTVKKIIKKVVKKKQVVDALTQGADQQEPAQEGQTDQIKSPVKKVIKVVKKVPKVKAQEDANTDIDLTLESNPENGQFWQEGAIEAAAKKKKIVKKIIKKKAVEPVQESQVNKVDADSTPEETTTQPNTQKAGETEPESKPKTKKLVKKIVKKKPLVDSQQVETNVIAEGGQSDDDQEAENETGVTKSGSTRVVTDVTKLKMKIKKKKPGPQQ